MPRWGLVLARCPWKFDLLVLVTLLSPVVWLWVDGCPIVLLGGNDL